MTSVDDGFPLEEPALVRDGIKVAALSVSEGRQAWRTCCRVADPVPAPLPQTVLPPAHWSAETVEISLESLLARPLPPLFSFFQISQVLLS